MKIIDSNKDFYDFYQGIYRDDSLVFDRRDSYNLKKSEFAGNFYLYYGTYGKKQNIQGFNNYLLLQVCNHFWLIKLEITDYTKSFLQCIDYKLSLVDHWKDYSVPPVMILLQHIDFLWHVKPSVDAVKQHNYKSKRRFDCFLKSRDYVKGKVVEDIRHIPILKDIGIASCVDPLDIYLAFEEYFSMQKTSSERTESIGLTNDEKITNHGFDLKTSFRGK